MRIIFVIRAKLSETKTDELNSICYESLNFNIQTL